MTASFPCPIIDGFVEALNTHDEERLAACFSTQAVVRDGGLEYCGPAAIRRWMQEVFEKYAMHLDLLEVTEDEEYWLFEALVSGRFEGSPVRLEHRLSITDGKITSLMI